jgi:integrase
MEDLMAHTSLPAKPAEATKVIAKIRPTAPKAPMQTMLDDACPGLYLQWGSTRQDDGRARPAWMLVFRDTTKFQHRVKLGFAWSYSGEPPEDWLTVEDARAEASRRKKAAKAGQPVPRIERAPAPSPAAPKSVLLEDAIQRYLDAKQPKSRQKDERMLATNLGALMSRPLTSITRTDTRKAVDAIKAPIVANRVYERLRAVFRYCQGREMITTIPLDPDKPHEESARDRILTDCELAKVWKAAGSLSLPLQGVIHLLALTAARRSRVAEMRWTELDLDVATWTVPAEKGAPSYVVPLTAPALEIIRGQQRIVDSPFVFTLDGKRPVSMSRAGGDLQKRTGIEDRWTLHDIRRTVRSGLPRLGVSPDTAERVIGHVITGIRSVYDRYEYLDEKRAALELWAGHVAKITGRCYGRYK